MTDDERLTRVRALLAALRAEHGVCDCARRLAAALGEEEPLTPAQRCVLEALPEEWQIHEPLPDTSPPAATLRALARRGLAEPLTWPDGLVWTSYTRWRRTPAGTAALKRGGGG